MITIEVKERIIGEYPILKGLSEKDWEYMSANATYMNIPAGALMFDENQPCMGYPFILSGRASILKSSPSGREIHLYEVQTGETCILTSGCLLSKSPYQARGIVREKVELVILSPGAFRHLLANLELFRDQVFSRFAERMSELMQLVTAVAFQKLDQRLAISLVSKPSPIRITHQAIADELGSFRELVSRILKDFEIRGWVKLERGKIDVLEPLSLKQFADV